jgi:hypothetical protein
MDSAPFHQNEKNWAGLTDYVSQIQVFKRVRLNREPGPNGFDSRAYFRDHIMCIDSVDEVVHNMPFGGEQKLWRLLLLPRTRLQLGNVSKEDAEDQEDASDLVHDMMANSAMWKCPAGLARFGDLTTLAQYWTRPGHTNDDCQPGTWGEYLRHGSVHFRQLRPPPFPTKAPNEADEVTEVGICEPVLN